MTRSPGKTRATSMAQRIREGATKNQVADEFGVSHQRVGQILKQHGFVEGTREWYRQRPANVARAFQRGGPDVLQEVIAANEFGARNPQTAMRALRYHCRQRGLPWPIRRRTG